MRRISRSENAFRMRGSFRSFHFRRTREYTISMHYASFDPDTTDYVHCQRSHGRGIDVLMVAIPR